MLKIIICWIIEHRHTFRKTSMTSAREFVEEKQKMAWNCLGIPPDQIEARTTDDLKKKLLYLSSVDPSFVYDESIFGMSMAQMAKANKTTEFQDPSDLYNFSKCWNRLIDAEKKDPRSKYMQPIAKPILASAPTGNLNAHSILGDDGSTAILLENGLELWGLFFTHAIVALFACDRDDRIEIRLSLDYIKESQIQIDQFQQLLILTAVTGSPEFAINEQGDHGFPRTFLVPELRDFSLLARDGFLLFVAGHEYAHLRLEHHTKIRTNNGTFKIPKNARKIWDKYVDKYNERFPNISKEFFINKIKRQFIEIEADCSGYQHAIAALAYDMRNSSDSFIQFFFSELGMLSFFLSIKYLERTVRTLANGQDGRDNPLISSDFDVQDVLLRKSHPSPMTRFRWICKIMDARLEGSNPSTTSFIADQLEALLTSLWETIYPKIQQIHTSGIRPHQRWIHPSTEMSCTLI